MALLNQPCGCTGTAATVIVFDDGTAPPVVGNVVTLPRSSVQQRWAGRGGSGITVTQPDPDTALGHEPTISLAISPQSPTTVTYDAQGRAILTAPSSAAISINGGTQVSGGIRATTGGTDGHTVTLAVAPSPSSPVPVSVNASGQLEVGPISVDGVETVWQPNAGQAVYRGIRWTAGGTAGHEPDLEIAPSGGSQFAIGFDSGGRLTVGLPAPLSMRFTPAASGAVTVSIVNTATGGSLTLGTV